MTSTTLTDSELKATCFDALTALVGPVGMERFIVLITREPRDYTKWRETQFCEDGETLEQLAAKIRAYVPPRRHPQAPNAKP
ncbi:MAG: hypothetical protein IJR99_03815 [Kiritimatiellae bacterium]|nr:hypothetical protein [Kiritimatiellia bacterium]